MKANQKMTKLIRTLIFSLIVMMGLIVFNSVAYADNYTVSSYTEFNSSLYKGMLKREKYIVITYKGADTSMILSKLKSEEFLTDVENIDDNSTSDDGIYMMKASYDGYKYSYKYVSGGIQVTIELTWEEEAYQLDYVNKQVEMIINATGVKNMNNAYDRAIALRDYLINNISYGKSSINTPYTALTSKVATCHSYSLLYYKLLKAADVDCYYVTGNVQRGWHAWNIVKLGDKWYNIDIAYENGYKNGSYSMKGSTSFSSTHKYDSYFSSTTFLNKYNISKTDFDKSTYAGGDLINNTQNQCVSKDKDASVVLNNSVSNNDKTNNINENITNNNNNTSNNETIDDSLNNENQSTTDNNEKSNKDSSAYDDSPKTGDASSVLMLITVGIISILSCCTVVIVKKYRK